ncbi:MAG: HDOD domain-containing protein [Lysobacterales bacterium]
MAIEVMFVDDEPDVLEGIENRLYSIRSNWRCRFAESGVEALKMLNQKPADVVVSDMRMPGMDGAEFLEVIKLRFPATVRIILSGETGARGFLRAAAVAHQVLSKPCDLVALQRLIGETLQLQERLHSETVVSAVHDLMVLPSLPEISARLEIALLDEGTFAQDVADILEEDPAIVSRILHVANSPFFRGAGEVSDLRTAITRLGFELIRGLVLSEELYSRIERGSVLHASVAQCQRETLRCAYIASCIALPSQDRRRLFIAAVLYGVGRLQRLSLPELHHADVADGELAGYLLSLWGLPFGLVQTVAFADQPSLLGCDGDHPAVTLHLALVLTRRLASAERVAWPSQPGFDGDLLASGRIDEARLDAAERAAADWQS